MAKWERVGGGRYRPPVATPGLQAALAAREATERALRARLAREKPDGLEATRRVTGEPHPQPTHGPWR